MTELSLEYRVHDPQLWSGLLQKLISFDMVSKASFGKGVCDQELSVVQRKARCLLSHAHFIHQKAF